MRQSAVQHKKHCVLEVHDLDIGYASKKKRVAIASNIHFSAQEGECIGIIGANGSGKSTLLRTLARLQPALAGAIFLNGKALSDYTSMAFATMVSLVLTEMLPVKNLSVAELIALGRQPHTNWIGTLTETDKIAIAQAMETTQITHLSNKPCYALSDGQMQKVMIARALAQQTPLILLDEPTTHLDLYHTVYILKLLKQIAHEQKKTLIFSTHEIDMAIQLCDMIVVMVADRAYFGTPQDLITQGVFQQLFPEGFMHFDAASGRFMISS